MSILLELTDPIVETQRCSQLPICVPYVCVSDAGRSKPVVVFRVADYFLIFHPSNPGYGVATWASDGAFMDEQYAVVRRLSADDKLIITEE